MVVVLEEVLAVLVEVEEEEEGTAMVEVEMREAVGEHGSVLL